MSDKRQEAHKGPVSKKQMTSEAFERLKAQQQAEMDAVRERTERLRKLRLAKEAQTRRKARKAARAGLSGEEGAGQQPAAKSRGR